MFFDDSKTGIHRACVCMSYHVLKVSLEMAGSVCLLVALLIVGIGAEDSDVIELEESSFDEGIAELDIILVEFYAPWYSVLYPCTCT